MLYLEDYLEMIENLPMEMREKLTEMREMDLQVQNSLDSLEERVKVFFKKCTQNTKIDWRDEEFGRIKTDYYKSLDDADEKVQLANHIYDLVDRHLRKLDQELSKFKMELEADNAGITEQLEKRSLEMDKPLAVSRTEKRRLPLTHSTIPNHSQEKRIATEKVLSDLANEAARETIGVRKSTSSGANPPAISLIQPNPSPTLSYSLGQMGAGSNAAIAAAASQAIAATQQVMQQGRRTPSMKASANFVAGISRGSEMTKEMPSKDSYSQPSTPTSGHEVLKQSRPKKQTAKAAQLLQQQQQQQQNALSNALSQVIPPMPPPSRSQSQAAVKDISAEPEDTSTELQIVDEFGQPVDWQNNPNEPRYCLCNQVSYGDMVGCDNDDCPIEWFHYGCVGLTQAPKGKWYCPQCTAAMKRRGRK